MSIEITRQLVTEPIEMVNGTTYQTDVTVSPDFPRGVLPGVFVGRNVRNVTFRNMTIQGPSSWLTKWNDKSNTYDGIYAHGCEYLTVEDCSFFNIPGNSLAMTMGGRRFLYQRNQHRFLWSALGMNHPNPEQAPYTNYWNGHVLDNVARDTWGPPPGTNWNTGGNQRSDLGDWWIGGDGLTVSRLRLDDSLGPNQIKGNLCEGEMFLGGKSFDAFDTEITRNRFGGYMIQGEASFDADRPCPAPDRRILIADNYIDLGMRDKTSRDHSCLVISHHNRGIRVERNVLVYPSSAQTGDERVTSLVRLDTDSHIELHGNSFVAAQPAVGQPDWVSVNQQCSYNEKTFPLSNHTQIAIPA